MQPQNRNIISTGLHVLLKKDISLMSGIKFFWAQIVHKFAYNIPIIFEL